MGQNNLHLLHFRLVELEKGEKPKITAPTWKRKLLESLIHQRRMNAFKKRLTQKLEKEVSTSSKE
jgi:hypothetical protein